MSGDVKGAGCRFQSVEMFVVLMLLYKDFRSLGTNSNELR